MKIKKIIQLFCLGLSLLKISPTYAKTPRYQSIKTRSLEELQQLNIKQLNATQRKLFRDRFVSEYSQSERKNSNQSRNKTVRSATIPNRIKPNRINLIEARAPKPAEEPIKNHPENPEINAEMIQMFQRILAGEEEQLPSKGLLGKIKKVIMSKHTLIPIAVGFAALAIYKLWIEKNERNLQENV